MAGQIAIPGGPYSPVGGTATASAPTPSVAPAAPPGSVQTAPGYSPDYAGLITNDPAYLSAQANGTLAQSSAAAQRKAALQQALVRYGGVPSTFTDTYGDIDPATQAAAAGNQYSTLAGLARTYAQNEQTFKQGLSARGALQSSELNYGEDQLQNAYGQQQYDAANATGSEINTALSAYTGVLGQNAQNMSSALQGAEANVYANPANRPTAATSAQYDAANSATYGLPIYNDGSGNLFDQNGNPYTPGSGAATPAPSGYAAPPAGGPVVPPGAQYETAGATPGAATAYLSGLAPAAAPSPYGGNFQAKPY